MPSLTPVQASAVALVCFSLSLACGSDDGGPRVPANIVVTPNHPTVQQGLTRQLSAVVVDAGGRVIAGEPVTFSSSDPLVATVSATGLVTSKGPLQQVFITAASGDITTTVDLTVQQRAVSLEVEPDNLVLNSTEAVFLQITALDFLGDPVLGANVTVESSDPTVVRVTGVLVQAQAATGSATLTIRAAGLTATVSVTVALIPTEIQVTPSGMVLSPNGTRQLNVIVVDRVGSPIPSPIVTFVSLSPALVSVSTSGLVRSLGPTGSGSVRVVSGSVTRDVPVFVGTGPQGILAATTPITGAPYAAAIGSNGAMVVSRAGASDVVRGTLPAYALPATIDVAVSRPLGVAVNPAGTTAYVAVTGAIAVVNLASNTPGTPIDHPVEFFSVLAPPSGNLIYAGTGGRVYAIDPTTREFVDSVEFGAVHLALHPTQPLLYATVGGSTAEINTTTFEIVRTLPAGGQSVAVSPDGSELYVAVEFGPLVVVNLTSGQIQQQVPLDGGCFGLAVTSNLIFVTSNSGKVHLLDRVSRGVLTSVDVGGTPRRLALNAAGTVAVVPNENGYVSFIE